MQIDFQCVKCEESFSLELSDISTDSALLKCPGCGARAPDEQVEVLVTGLEELAAAIAGIRRKFTVVTEVNSEELPPPYDEAPMLAKKAALLDEANSDEDEDEEELEEDLEEREETEV